MLFFRYFQFIWFMMQLLFDAVAKGRVIDLWPLWGGAFVAFFLYIANICLFVFSFYKIFFLRNTKKALWILALFVSLILYVLGCFLAEAFWQFVASV